MAEEEGGYDDEQFVDVIDDNLKCPLCLLILREPHLLSCCGTHICRVCIGRLNSSLCPCCRTDDYKTLLNKQLRGVVISLRVKCPNTQCTWQGELGDRIKHIIERCEFGEGVCQYGCGIKLMKKDLIIHEKDACPKIPVTVAIQRFQELMKVTVEEMKSVHHIEIEALQTELIDQKKIISSCIDKQDEYEQEIADLRTRLKQQEEKGDLIKTDLTKTDLPKTDLIKTDLSNGPSLTPKMLQLPMWWPHPLPISEQIYPPCVLVMPYFSLQCKDTDEWFSPPFYSGQRGYRMCLRVRAIGQGCGLNTYVAVFVHLMRSNNDDKLKWPLSTDVKIQILNSREDANHVELTVPFTDKMQLEARGRVRERERATKGIGFHEFIRKDSLNYNIVTNTEYLQNDCIMFRIVNVK